MSKKWYEWLLTLVYLAMVGLCVFLNFTPGHRESLATIIVNAIMFLIVAVIFLSADIKSFIPMNKIIADLKQASEKIRSDAMNVHSYLWEPYRTSNTELFKSKKMQELFRDFLFDINRGQEASKVYYRTNIDDYVNDELVDTVMHRNEMNQIPGIMTGLGILGTFIGLSLGLQSFNTGTTAQMTESIEPLMNGIKVAFHTSIYGMVFSLVFNAVYKKKLFEADNAVDEFITSFKRFVLPDTDNDGMNRMLAVNEEQVLAINNLTSRIGEEISVILTPQFERLNSTITDFENMATRNQTEALNRLINVFLEGMSMSLGNTFDQLSKAVDDMYNAQKETCARMNDLLNTTGSSTQTLNNINAETSKLVSTLNKYSESIQTIQAEMQRTVSLLSSQNENSRNMIVKELDTLKEQDKLLEGFKATVAELARNTNDSNESMSEALMEVSDALHLVRKQIYDKQHDSKRR